MTPLDSIREELAKLRIQIGSLERAEVVLEPVYEPMLSSSKASQPVTRDKRKRARSSRAGNPGGAQICEFIASHGPVTRVEIMTVLGGTTDSIKNHLTRLLNADKITVEGARGARLYSSSSTPCITPVPSVDNLERVVRQKEPEPGVYPVLDEIIELQRATTAELQERTGLPTNLVVEQGRRLVRLGHVRFTGVGKERVWLPARPPMERAA